jgi:hypothetical protein
MTTGGAVTTYTATGLSFPATITAGPDGAIWFTDGGGGWIGRITTSVTPGITSLSGYSGDPGKKVTIQGGNLGGAIAVTFNGTPATISSDTAKKIVTHVPAGATSGFVTVTTSAGVATSSEAFTVT